MHGSMSGIPEARRIGVAFEEAIGEGGLDDRGWQWGDHGSEVGG
jgi:hypothetical protein